MRRFALLKSVEIPQLRFDVQATDKPQIIEDYATENLLEKTMITPMSVGFFVEPLDQCALP